MDLGALRSGPEAGAAIDGSALLKVLVPQLWERLGGSERAILRACSREALRLSDSCVRSLKLSGYKVNTLAKQAAAVAELRSMLARGIRPRTLELCATGAHRQRAALGLRVLAELRAASPPPQLTKLQLIALPLTAAVVRAIAAAAPYLSELALCGYEPSYCTGLPSSLPFRPSLSGVQGLLRLAAPHLQQLFLKCMVAPVYHSRGADAHTDLASLLLQCSRLETLTLTLWDTTQVPNSSFAVLMSALAQLPALRSLDMILPPASNGGCCGRLSPTGLTRLVLRGTLDLDVAVPVLAGMRSLTELQLRSCKLQPRHLQQMTSLTALTRLLVVGIGATDEPSSDAAAGGFAEPTQPQVPLPAQLRALVYCESASPCEVMALQLPSAPLLRLDVHGLALSPDDKDLEGRLRPTAAEALLAACGRLAGRLWHGPDGGDPFELDLDDAAAPASWPDGYGTLFAAMQPLALRGLTLQNATLTLYDMDALVRHLPLLQYLHLQCAVEVPSLPLLCRLEQLVYLRLSPGGGGVVEGWDSELALRAALLVVCAEAPSLQDVCLIVDHKSEALFEVAALAVDWLDEELPTLRDNPPFIEVG